MDMGDGLFIDFVPFDGLFDRFTERVLRSPAEVHRSLAGVRDQTMNFARYGSDAIRAFGHEQFDAENRRYDLDDFRNAVFFARSEVEDFSDGIALARHCKSVRDVFDEIEVARRRQ